MSECRNYLRRCIRAIAAEPSTRPRLYLQNRIAPHARPSQPLRQYTTESTSHAAPQTAIVPQEDYKEPPPSRLNPRSAERLRIKQNAYRKVRPDVEDRDGRNMPNISRTMLINVSKELSYLPDPLQLAEHVHRVLKKGDLEKALSLARLASKDMDCVVSWNHIIGHLLSQRKVSSAFKIYNEMKKRAQFPDTYTYAIMLRGLSEPPVAKESLLKALSIYHSLGAVNSRVNPTTVHTNAALRVCARAHDMDSLWGIAAKIPERGAGAADAHTYTTILNAIREHALLESGGSKDDHEIAALRMTAVEQGRRIWRDVVGGWRAGRVTVDERMVAAMGRLLLISLRPADWDDILSLIEQTTGVPRMAPRLGSAMRKAEHLPIRIPEDVYKTRQDVVEGEEPESEFDRSLLLDNRGKDSVILVKPGNSSLSMIIEACGQTYAFREAHQYWSLLTDKAMYNLSPDLDNVHTYMRVLRATRASSRTLELLEETLVARGLEPLPKTFRIAMSACTRDKNNPNVMENASKIVKLREHYKLAPDPKMLTQYVELATSTQDGKVIKETIDGLTDTISQLRSTIASSSGKGSLTHRLEVLGLLRTVAGALDQSISKKMVPEDQMQQLVQRRRRLARHLTRAYDGMEGTDVIPREKIIEMRRENRQLRHYRQKLAKRQKKADGTWVENKKDLKRSEPLKELPVDA